MKSLIYIYEGNDSSLCGLINKGDSRKIEPEDY